MSDTPDLSEAVQDFVMTPEQQARHDAEIAKYEEKKRAKLEAKGLSEAPPSRSQLVISFVMSNLIRQKGDTPIPAEIQEKVDEALVNYIQKNVNERKRFARVRWAPGHGVAPMFGGALRSITLSGVLNNEYSSDDYLDVEDYKAWKRNPTGEVKEKTEDDEDEDSEDDYDEDDEDEEEEEEEEDDDEEAPTDPAEIALLYAKKADEAIEKFTEFQTKTFEEVKAIDAEADANPGKAYSNLLHIPKVTSIKLERMSTV